MALRRLAASMLIGIAAVSTVPSIAVTQEQERGTMLVCIGAGGDGLTLEEWTPEQVADYEERSGRDIAFVAAHRRTGSCVDVAGLMGGWVPGTAWLCSQGADGRWIGPAWVWSVYQQKGQVPPDPVSGSCPGLHSGFQTGRDELEKAAATAVYLTQLEVEGDYDRLYAWMHSDSKAVVPPAAMEGWYREEFSERLPVWMTVDDVQLVEWTWDVTGKVYPSAAEVSYRQRFADGEEAAGVVRLVRERASGAGSSAATASSLRTSLNTSAPTAKAIHDPGV